jgi:4-amino-4-deoxy-L-arabinose transferase-like glycosyltransferase
MRNGRYCNRFAGMREWPRGGRLHAMLTGLKSKIQNPKPEIILLLICAVAFALRLGPLFDNRFHPDEALFSTWALKIARGENLLLTGVPVDKPPLLIYLTALSFFIFGQSELAARVPNLIASVISVPLLYQLARNLTPGVPFPLSRFGAFAQRPVTKWSGQNRERGPGGEVSALLLALSPFAVLFAPTAFLDPMMIMFGLTSLLAASRGRAGWAGILLGLAFAVKVQGLFFAPLVLIFWQPRPLSSSSGHLAILSHRDTSSHHPVWRFSLACLAIMLMVLLWDRARSGLPFWVQQTINYGGIRLVYASELAPRLTGWLNFLPYFFGPIVGLLGLISLPFLLYRDFTRDARTRSAWIDLWLFSYTIGFLAFHWLFAFPVWDRYLLILVPITALLLGRSLHLVITSAFHLVTRFTRLSMSSSLLLSIVFLAMLPFSLAAAESQYPIGGDHGANDGIEQVAGYLKSLPSGTVVYDHWLAWELGYYLGDGFAYLAYFDTPAALADDLRVFAHDDARYVIFPAREAPDKVNDAIEQVGYTLTPVLETKNRFGEPSFAVFRIVKRNT